MAKKILISGGCGFVGRNLCYALMKESPAPEITIIDDLSTGRSPETWELQPARLSHDPGWARQYVLPDQPGQPFTFIHGNFIAVLAGELGLAKRTSMPELPVFDEVYHLASIVGGRQMIEGQPLLVGIDLAIDSLFFLWASVSAKARRILYASSSAAYPVTLQQDQTFRFLTEDMIDFANGVLAPDLTYGWSKLTGEYLARLGVEKNGLRVGIVRPFSGYGEDQDPTYPVPAIALRVAARHNPVQVWGSGLQGRDFVHIDDCIEGLILTCRTIEDASAVNLGSGVLTSFLDLARLMVSLEGYDAVVTGKDNRPVGVANRVSGSKRAESVIGWRPKIGLEDGMGRVVRHAGWRLKNGYAPES
jgi:nucleoside-diphosphate-sugar epimerase